MQGSEDMGKNLILCRYLWIMEFNLPVSKNDIEKLSILEKKWIWSRNIFLVLFYLGENNVSEFVEVLGHRFATQTIVPFLNHRIYRTHTQTNKSLQNVLIINYSRSSKKHVYATQMFQGQTRQLPHLLHCKERSRSGMILDWCLTTNIICT